MTVHHEDNMHKKLITIEIHLKPGGYIKLDERAYETIKQKGHVVLAEPFPKLELPKNYAESKGNVIEDTPFRTVTLVKRNS